MTLARRSPSCGFERGAGVSVVVGDLSHHPDLGLPYLLDARILQPRERTRTYAMCA